MNSGQFPIMENCVSFDFSDAENLEKKVLSCQKNGGTYAVIIEPFSASLLKPCSQDFMDKLFQFEKKARF